MQALILLSITNDISGLSSGKSVKTATATAIKRKFVVGSFCERHRSAYSFHKTAFVVTEGSVFVVDDATAEKFYAAIQQSKIKVINKYMYIISCLIS